MESAEAQIEKGIKIIFNDLKISAKPHRHFPEINPSFQK